MNKYEITNIQKQYKGATLFIDKKFWNLILSGKKEYEIRKERKIYYPNREKPVRITFINSKNEEILGTAKLWKEKYIFKENRLPHYLDFDNKTIKFFYKNYFGKYNTEIFKITDVKENK